MCHWYPDIYSTLFLSSLFALNGFFESQSNQTDKKSEHGNHQRYIIAWIPDEVVISFLWRQWMYILFLSLKPERISMPFIPLLLHLWWISCRHKCREKRDDNVSLLSSQEDKSSIVREETSGKKRKDWNGEEGLRQSKVWWWGTYFVISKDPIWNERNVNSMM